MPVAEQSLLKKYTPVVGLFLLANLVFLLTRLTILISFPGVSTAGWVPLAGSFLIGAVYDVLVSALIVLPVALHVLFTNNFIYTKRGKLLIFSSFVLIFSIILFTSVVPKEFNRQLYHALLIYLALRFFIFLFLGMKSHSFRLRWRTAVVAIWTFVITFLLLFNAVSEYFFWNEFASRYNFIAVDYLIYTNEVIGNIQESYPVTAILLAVAFFSSTLLYVRFKSIRSSVTTPLSIKKRLAAVAVLAGSATTLALIVQPDWKDFSNNNYADELAGNGLYDFNQAFQTNELDFFKYYKTLPDSVAFRLIRQQLADSNTRFISNDLFDLRRRVDYPEPEKRMNVVLISVESLSASFMKKMGSHDDITPGLDSLADKGLFFTNLYASGTRTVRGLEALSLALPPLPGQSLVKRPNNENLFGLGSIFRSKGYTTQYIYGGYGYFDNMNYFFGHNDYEVIDRSALKASEIHYANIWGVADEDLFTLALRNLDKNYSTGKPFFSHIMTVSNHRPFTYPEGRISIPPSTQSREGAVKYTDYAICRFIKEASQKAWFKNTVFVIVADHCASSSGSQALPVTGYHIPMIIYAPAMLSPKRIDALTAQIDIAPTLLGLLNFDYSSKFLGQDILRTIPEKQRAFICTYQSLGYLQHDTLTVLSPVKQSGTFLPDFLTGEAKEIEPDHHQTQLATAYYQVSAWLIKNKQYGSKMK